MRKVIDSFRREFNGPKVVGETLIIVVGVFLGIQASNWNDARRERVETAQVLRDLQPELTNLVANFETLQAYYRVTRRYADTAFAGWRGDPAISDNEFVIASYQASQNSFTGLENSSWSQIFGSDRLRDLSDQQLRDQLSILMTTDFVAYEKELFTDYRRHVREVIPEDVQDVIRRRCGDRRIGRLGFAMLPAACDLQLPRERAAAAARELRAHPELLGQMRWHFAAVASYVDNIASLETITKSVLRRIAADR